MIVDEPDEGGVDESERRFSLPDDEDDLDELGEVVSPRLVVR